MHNHSFYPSALVLVAHFATIIVHVRVAKGEDISNVPRANYGRRSLNRVKLKFFIQTGKLCCLILACNCLP